jgi:hypothetical protein
MTIQGAKNVAEMQLNSQNPSPKKEKIYEV